MRFPLIVGAVLLVSGCSGPGIVPMGQDTYMLARDGSFTTFGGGAVKAELYKEAHAFCVSQGREILPLRDASRDSGYGRYANAEIQFRCLRPGDPALSSSGPQSERSIKIRSE